MMPLRKPMDAVALVSLNVEAEGDIVLVRQRARQIGEHLGFSRQDQVRIATAVSEVARNVTNKTRGGRVEFTLSLNSSPPMLVIKVFGTGTGIHEIEKGVEGRDELSEAAIGGLAARRLMDTFRFESIPGRGSAVVLGKALPLNVPVNISNILRTAVDLTRQRPPATDEELQQQNTELLETLEILRAREAELESRQAELKRLNLELEETNRGVVALYAELDEKALALRRADELKSRFLSHVSHEFRTPLNAILALAHLLLRRTDGELTAEQERQVDYIRRAAGELSEMVNDLLDLAKVEAGRTEVRRAAMDVGQLFRALRGIMRPLAINEAVALVFEEPAGDLTIVSDEAKVSQILRNLISNALKFTETGQVCVSCRTSAAGDRLLISVADTGIGIAPENLEKIFVEFAQIESAIQRRVKGTGLGLSLSRKLAGLLGGSIDVKSVLGEGSTFILSLPFAQIESEEARRPADASQHADAILIIDNEETARYIARQLLRGTRYRILEASNAAEGVDRARFDHPALILLDLGMPGRTGFDALDDLKSDASTADIPVVVHTSRELTDSDYKRLRGRHAAVLPKGSAGRAGAFETIRSLLAETRLFADEPEFRPPGNRTER